MRFLRDPMRFLRDIRRALYNRTPPWMLKNDFELFTALLCVSAGVPLLLTDQVDAASIEATLPLPLVKVWSLMLAVAPIVIGVGLFMASRRPMHLATFWIRFEAWGLRALAYAAYIYAIAIVVTNGLRTAPALAIIIAFGLTCHSRATVQTMKVERYLEALGTRHARP